MHGIFLILFKKLLLSVCVCCLYENYSTGSYLSLRFNIYKHCQLIPSCDRASINVVRTALQR